MKLTPGPVLRQIGTDWYWFPEGPTTELTKALAGPFPSKAAAKWARIERLEARFSPEQKSLWAECCVRAGADVDILTFVAQRIRRGIQQTEPMERGLSPRAAILRWAGLPKPDWRDGQ